MKKNQAELDRIDMQIRRLMVREPNISGRRIAVILKHDKDFIIKRKKKIDRANRDSIQRSTIEKDLAELENLYQSMAQDMYAIITGGGDKKSQIMAFNSLFKARRELIDSKMDAGIFKRELGKLEIETDLSPEQKAVMDAAINKLYGDKGNSKRSPKNPKGKASIRKK